MVKLAARVRTQIFIMNSEGVKVSGRVCSREGFTFLEILLVVVLAGLLASVAGGIYVGTHRRALVKKGAMDFLLAAKYARITAIESQGECRMKLDRGENKFVLVVGQADGFGDVEDVVVKDLYFKPTVFEGDVKFEEVSIRPSGSEAAMEESQDTITFWPDGSANESLVQIGDGKSHYTVRVSAVMGRVMLFEGLAENVESDSVDLDEVEF